MALDQVVRWNCSEGVAAIVLARNRIRCDTRTTVGDLWVARTARGSGEWHPDAIGVTMPSHRLIEMNVAGIA